MTDQPLNEAELAALRALDTPTMCNAIELFYPERRGFGFTTSTLHCVRPDLPPMVGYARTLMARTRQPSGMTPEEHTRSRFDYLDYIAKGPKPSIAVVQDIDDGHAGFGCFWGEVMSNILMALGGLGTITNGGVRDIPDLSEGFQALAGALTPSHAHVHAVALGCQVDIAGMVVQDGDLLHADQHGAVVVPHDIARQIPEKAALIGRREAVILEACRQPGVSAESIKDAMRASGKVD